MCFILKLKWRNYQFKMNFLMSRLGGSSSCLLIFANRKIMLSQIKALRITNFLFVYWYTGVWFCFAMINARPSSKPVISLSLNCDTTCSSRSFSEDKRRHGTWPVNIPPTYRGDGDYWHSQAAIPTGEGTVVGALGPPVTQTESLANN